MSSATCKDYLSFFNKKFFIHNSFLISIRNPRRSTKLPLFVSNRNAARVKRKDSVSCSLAIHVRWESGMFGFPGQLFCQLFGHREFVENSQKIGMFAESSWDLPVALETSPYRVYRVGRLRSPGEAQARVLIQFQNVQNYKTRKLKHDEFIPFSASNCQLITSPSCLRGQTRVSEDLTSLSIVPDPGGEDPRKVGVKFAHNFRRSLPGCLIFDTCKFFTEKFRDFRNSNQNFWLPNTLQCSLLRLLV